MRKLIENSAFNIYMNYIRHSLVEIIQDSSKLMSRQQLLDQSDQTLFYGGEHSFHPPKPHTIKNPPPEVSESHREWRIPELFVATLADVELIGPNAVAVTSSGDYILENAVGKPEMLVDSIIKSIYTGNIPIHTNSSVEFNSDPVVNLSGIQSQAFFHWFVDYLPKVRGIELYDKHYEVYPELLIPRNPPRWLVSSLNLCGVPSEKINYREVSRCRVNSLVIPSVPRYTSIDSPHGGFTRSPQALKWVGERLTSNVEQPDLDERRVFITRRSADSRRIINEEEIVNMLSEYEFTPVNLSTMSLHEQIKLFESATFVVAPHGAGLINMIYASELKILEIFGEFVSSIYYKIAGGLGHEYALIQCDDAQSENGSSIVESRDNRDIMINKEKLKSILETHWDI